MNAKTVLITGANRGIGLEMTKIYCQKGWNVLAVCRKASESLKETGASIFEGIDVSEPDAVEALNEKLGSASIDILISNAGILTIESLDKLDIAQIRKQFEINAIGPILVTHAVLNRLNAGSKIILMTSRMGSVEDNGSGAYYGYRMSKAALNAAGKSLAIDLKPKEIPVILMHPGFVTTEMTQNQGNISPAEAAQQIIDRVDTVTLENTGQFWHANGESLPW